MSSVALEYCRLAKNGLADRLETVQSLLLDLGSHVATPRNTDLSDSKRLGEPCQLLPFDP